MATEDEEMDAAVLPRAVTYPRLHARLVTHWDTTEALVRGAVGAWRTVQALCAVNSLTAPADPLLPLPAELSLHVLSFLHAEPALLGGSWRVAGRAWALSAARLTLTAAQAQLQGGGGGSSGESGAGAAAVGSCGASVGLYDFSTVTDHALLMLEAANQQRWRRAGAMRDRWSSGRPACAR